MGTPHPLAAVLASMDASWLLPRAALTLADAGIPVFPCAPGGKRPIAEHGFHDATTNQRLLEGWWRAHPSANIGVPTGLASGMGVVDIDIRGETGFPAFAHAYAAGLLSGWELAVRTPSGGMHVYYPTSVDREQPCWQAGKAAIDFRGDGGYVVVPPSYRRVDDEVRFYLPERRGQAPGRAIDAAGLRRFLDPRPLPQVSTGPAPDRGIDVERIAAWVGRRHEGERNAGLFWAACTLAEHGVAPPDAIDALHRPAEQAGLGERETLTTIRSAYRTVGSAGNPPSRSDNAAGASPAGASTAPARAITWGAR